MAWDATAQADRVFRRLGDLFELKTDATKTLYGNVERYYRTVEGEIGDVVNPETFIRCADNIEFDLLQGTVLVRRSDMREFKLVRNPFEPEDGSLVLQVQRL